MTGRKTERVSRWRQKALDPSESKLLNDVERYGCHVVHVGGDSWCQGWSYTVGIHDVSGGPELIVIGLKNDLAHFVLNECDHRIQGGLRLSEGCRQRDLVSDVECEFRPVERRWILRTMGCAAWFYGGDHFPVFQCVYPDLKNHFPWESGFDPTWRTRQPLLFPHSLDSRTEEDFWSANDLASSLHDWRFEASPHTMVFTTKRVMNGEDAITRVFHDIEDGAWQFHGPGESRSEDATLVCFHHIIDNDPTVRELFDLPRGWCAWREDVAAPWSRELASPDDPEEEGEPKRG